MVKHKSVNQSENCRMREYNEYYEDDFGALIRM